MNEYIPGFTARMESLCYNEIAANLKEFEWTYRMWHILISGVSH